MSNPQETLQAAIEKNVRNALAEDLGSGDLTAALLPADAMAKSAIITRQPMVLAGGPWLDEVFRQLDGNTTVEWLAADGDLLGSGQTLCLLRGTARTLLSGERTALNFLQLLSATATITRKYVAATAGTKAKILDTRKTIPGLRLAQKYAVRCGGGVNHRVGLFDAILIKENHILAAGGIEAAVTAARNLHPDLPVEIEVETLRQLQEALEAGVEQVLLDNFSIAELREAVALNAGSAHPAVKLEASGGVTFDTVADIAEAGVDYISVGALTKHVAAIDLSMRFE